MIARQGALIIAVVLLLSSVQTVRVMSKQMKVLVAKEKVVIAKIEQAKQAALAKAMKMPLNLAKAYIIKTAKAGAEMLAKIQVKEENLAKSETKKTDAMYLAKSKANTQREINEIEHM